MNLLKSFTFFLLLTISILSCSEQKIEPQISDKDFLEEKLNIPSSDFNTMTVSFSISQTQDITLCSVHEISFEELIENNETFAQVLNDLGINEMNICICGGGYCDWEADMLSQFIYDTNVWDLTKIEVHLKNSNGGFDLISESLEPVLSPSGNYAFIEMSNKLTLQELITGSETKITFSWITPDGREACAILQNIIP